jgi:hypothetical protein
MNETLAILFAPAVFQAVVMFVMTVRANTSSRSNL